MYSNKNADIRFCYSDIIMFILDDTRFIIKKNIAQYLNDQKKNRKFNIFEGPTKNFSNKINSITPIYTKNAQQLK